MQGKTAFTLVELIIVIIILIILASIAFITLKDYPRDARDTIRKTDLKSLEKVMTMYNIENGGFPLPDNPKDTPKKNGWLEGELGNGVYGKIQRINPLPTDPSRKTFYEYELGPNKKLYRIIANLENGQQFIVGNYKTNTSNLPYCDFSGNYKFGGCLIQ